ncbi:MAG TPA: hypothetical protein VH985_26390 [Candidatus Binatia bacterium]|jgi:hypothetical protein
MQIFQATLWLYAKACKRSLECVRKNWIVSFAPVAYGIALTIVLSLVAPLGLIGGLLYSFASVACASSGLYLIKNMVESGKADFNDFLNGFMAYLWELMTIAFILWIPMRLAGGVLAASPNGALIFLLVKLALYVLLNAVPELIYQTRTTGIELISASYNFIVENWIEWLAPNILLLVVGYYLLEASAPFLFGLPAFLSLFLYSFLMGLGLVYLMTFRGFLFTELHGTTRRSRIYRYKARTD